MITNELKIHHSHLNIPLHQKHTKNLKYCFEWVEDKKDLEDIYMFRALQFSKQFGISFLNGRDQDQYDSICKHAILRDVWSNEIVAYTRVKFLYGDEIQQSYSQNEFYLDQIFLPTDRIIEIGRTCVHMDYRSSKVLSILWMYLFHEYIQEVQADYLIGCVSIKILENEEKVYATHQYIQQLESDYSCAIRSKNTFEIMCQMDDLFAYKKIPKLFDIYLKMNGQFSKQAYYDREFNCLDYFVLMKVSQMSGYFLK